MSLLLCDSVIVDAISQKKTLVGIFDLILAVSVPAGQKMGLYARLTDLDGAYIFKARVVCLSDSDSGEELVFGLETPMSEWSDPLQIVELALNLPPILFPKFGRYEVQLFANEIYIGRAVVTVSKVEASKN